MNTKRIAIISSIAISILISIAVVIAILHILKKKRNKAIDELGKVPKREERDPFAYTKAIELPSIKVFETDDRGNTPLHIVSRLDHEKLTIYCLNHAVINCDEPSTIKILTEYVNKKNKDGDTPLHLAVQNNSIAPLEILLKHRSTDINLKNNNGDTALHLAIKNNNQEIVKKLLDRGAAINFLNKEGEDAKTLAKKHNVSLASSQLNNTESNQQKTKKKNETKKIPQEYIQNQEKKEKKSFTKKITGLFH
jgi:ankyrin repeat protein